MTITEDCEVEAHSREIVDYAVRSANYHTRLPSGYLGDGGSLFKTP